MESYRDIKVYDLSSYFIITASVKQRNFFKVLKIRKETNSLEISDDTSTLSPKDFDMYLQRVLPEDRAAPIATGHAILGLIRFLQGFYLFLVTKKQKIGEIREKSIYQIVDTKLIKLFSDKSTKNEERYRDLFKSLDISLGFYFSYSYDLTRTLQENVALTLRKPRRHRTRKSVTAVPDLNRLNSGLQDRKPPPWNLTYVWNHSHLVPMLSVLKDRQWVTPIIHGFIGHQQLSILSRRYDLLLIARRSRFFAGTRYLKRGLNEEGKVANDVETEQILVEKVRYGRMSSFVQVRGSIPLFWCQDPNPVIPSPAIILNQNDFLHEGTRIHFADLLSRYGSPVIIMNLNKKDPNHKEYSISNEYKSSVDFINEKISPEFNIDYTNFDIKKASKESKDHCIKCLYGFGTEKLRKIGVFYLKSSTCETTLKFQTGVVRTNCIDCIDRTNAAQMLVGHKALEQMMKKMDLIDHLETDSHILKILSGLYYAMGDMIALQYSGSEAHKHFSKENTHRANYFFTSIKRHWANLMTDNKKQQSINLFLGVFKPHENNIHLWEIEDDSRLHNTRRLGYDFTPDWCSTESAKFATKLGIGIVPEETPDHRIKISRSKSSYLNKWERKKMFARTFQIALPLLTEPHSTKLFSFNYHFGDSTSEITHIVFSEEEIYDKHEPVNPAPPEPPKIHSLFDSALSQNDIQLIENYMKLDKQDDVQVSYQVPEEDYEAYINQEPIDFDFTNYFNLTFNESLLENLSLEDLVFLNNF